MMPSAFLQVPVIEAFVRRRGPAETLRWWFGLSRLPCLRGDHSSSIGLMPTIGFNATLIAAGACVGFAAWMLRSLFGDRAAKK